MAEQKTFAGKVCDDSLSNFEAAPENTVFPVEHEQEDLGPHLEATQL